MTKAEKIVDKMYQNDAFSQWLGIKVIEINGSRVTLQMVVRPEMTNGFNVTHGGITYSLADSALAFASNGHGRLCMSIETSISHTHSVNSGDVLTAVSEELSLSNRIGVYQVTVTNQNEKVVALFKGTVFRKDKDWEV